MVNLDDFPDYMDHVTTPMHFAEMTFKVDEHACVAISMMALTFGIVAIQVL